MFHQLAHVVPVWVLLFLMGKLFEIGANHYLVADLIETTMLVNKLNEYTGSGI